MRILDKNGNEVTNPDLEKGYLTTETIILAHHEAQPETPAIKERVVIEDDGEGNVLYGERVTQEWKPARGAWDETETIQRYTLYTKQELAEREQAKKEEEEAAKRAEAEAKAEAERQAVLNAIPARVDDIEEGVAEVGVMVADTTENMDVLMEAVAELGVMVAEMQEA